MRWIAPFVLLAIFFLLVRRQVFTWPYYYDEADYMYAASLGLHANYADAPAQSLFDFVRIGMSKGKGAVERAEMSREIRRSDDVNFYRHWHGPLYFYWLLALAPFNLSEPATRSWSYAFPVLTFLFIYAGSLWLLPGREGILAGILGGAFYLWSYATIRTNEIAPHECFVLCYIAALLFLMKWRSTGAARYWNAAVVASAGAFCTLEVAFVLVAVLLVCAALATKLTDWRWMGKSALLFVGSVLMLWPGAVLKLSFLKAYLFMAYLALYRPSPWGRVSVLETWRLRFTHSPVEWLLVAGAVLAYFLFCDRPTRRSLFPVLLYASLMLLVVLRVATDTPRYTLPFLPAFHLFAGLVFASILKGWKPLPQAVAASAVCLLVLWNAAAQIAAHPILPAPRLHAELVKLGERHPEGKKLLVPQDDLPMIHYYFPGANLWGYVDEQEKTAWLTRERFDVVLQASGSE
ncbi:MAG: hypothetical protein ABSB86_09465 [Bryobacteraceae bacterium]